MPENIDMVISTAKLAAQLILKNGGETYRAEDTARRICGAYGYEADVLALPTGLMLSIKDTHAAIGRVSRRTVDLAVIDQVNAISRRLASGELDVCDAHEELGKIARAEDRGPRVITCLYAAGSAAMFAVMFLGGWFDVAAAGICAGFVQLVLRVLPDDSGLPIGSLAGGFLTALMAMALTTLFHMGDSGRIIISGIMPLLPGLAVTNAIRDSMRGDLVSGVARAGDAIMRAVVLAVGAGFAISIFVMIGGGA